MMNQYKSSMNGCMKIMRILSVVTITIMVFQKVQVD
jgi:hypothetical protein